jgi:hypothetical protein
LRNTPLLRKLNFWKVLLAQYQWITAPDFSLLNSPFPKQLGLRRQRDLTNDNQPTRRRRLNGKAIEPGAVLGAGNRSAPVRRERTEAI